jgi:hypothetical protein
MTGLCLIWLHKLRVKYTMYMQCGAVVYKHGPVIKDEGAVSHALASELAFHLITMFCLTLLMAGPLGRRQI